MKRVALLLLAALALLSACGPVPAAETTAETAIETETFTEAETTTAFIPQSGESNGVKWRMLDLEDEANAELKEELLRRESERVQKEFQMGDKKIAGTVDTKHPKYQLTMVDGNGEETLLLESTYLDEAATPEEASLNELSWKHPDFRQALDDRYFLFAWDGWEWICGYGIYDTKEMREIPIECYAEMFANDGILYSYNPGDDGGKYIGSLHLLKYDWRSIVRGEPLESTDLLAGFSGADVEGYFYFFLTKDARYYLAIEREELRVYDLAAKKLDIVSIPPLDSAYLFLEWNGKVYWIGYTGHYYAIEITLP